MKWIFYIFVIAAIFNGMTKNDAKSESTSTPKSKPVINQKVVSAQKELGTVGDGIIGSGTCKAYFGYSDEKLNNIFKGSDTELQQGMGIIDAQCDKYRNNVSAEEKQNKWISCRVAIKKMFDDVSISKSGYGTENMYYDGKKFEAIATVKGENAFGKTVKNFVKCTIENGMITIDNGIDKHQFYE